MRMPKFFHSGYHLQICSVSPEKSLLLSTGKQHFSTAGGQINCASRDLQATDFLDVYRGLVAQGRLKFDEDQVRVVMELRRLQKRLTNYVPPEFISSITSNKDIHRKSNELWWLHAEMQPTTSELRSLVRLKSHADEIANLNTPKGLFLTGHPGSGKSMLVDLWFSIVPTPHKVRKHYSTLILEIYRGVWYETRCRQALLSSSSKSAPQTSWNRTVRDRWRSLFASGIFPSLSRPNEISNSPYMPSISYSIARRLLLSHWLLVFDEIQLLDVSSAGLLSDVLSWFWRMGGVIVGTSNKVPDDLYRNGVQKERLEPFVEALKQRCPVIDMRGTTDYRELKATRGLDKTWFVHGQEKEFAATVRRLSQGGIISKTIEIFGRHLPIREISEATCQFTFGELCDHSLGPADYISIASRYSTVVLTDVPVFHPGSKNQGRRFISLIDALYESRCRLVCMSESTLDGLFFPDTLVDPPSGDDTNDYVMMAESVSETRESFRPNVVPYDSLLHSKVPKSEPFRLETLSIFSGEEERFAYQRAYSRLLEMTSPTYKKENEWRPLSIESRTWETSAGGEQGEAEMPQVDASLDGDNFSAAAVWSHAERERPPAPKFSEDHVWGVREDWGPKAKAWGKGAAIYNNDENR